MQNNFIESLRQRVHPFLRGHLYLFDDPIPTSYLAANGIRLLVIFVAVEILFRPAIVLASREAGVTGSNWWFVTLLLILFCLFFLLIKFFAKVSPAQLGLHPWKQWSRTEQLYFLQIFPIAIIVFSVLRMSQLKALSGQSNFAEIVLFALVPQIFWGLYQEFFYRGILQTELVRRWGALKGIFASNLIFTFGPLHAYHFITAQKNPSYLLMFVAIFAIGLLFAFIFRRSGNLWIVGIMHGIGDLFITGLAKDFTV